jgi:hypothetical protein
MVLGAASVEGELPITLGLILLFFPPSGRTIEGTDLDLIQVVLGIIFHIPNKRRTF